MYIDMCMHIRIDMCVNKRVHRHAPRYAYRICVRACTCTCWKMGACQSYSFRAITKRSAAADAEIDEVPCETTQSDVHGHVSRNMCVDMCKDMYLGM